MRTIQEVGTEILTNNPTKFYIFAGSEYGIKCKYLEHLKQYYNNNVMESDSVNTVFNMFKTKTLIPAPPTLYIVRYDVDFVSSLNDTKVKQLNINSINGTLVCIYEDIKQIEKLDKYLSKYIVSIDTVNIKFIKKYLQEDFPQLNERLLDIISKSCMNYNHAKNLASCVISVDSKVFDDYSDIQILNIFGMSNELGVDKVKEYVINKNFVGLNSILSNTSVEYDSFIYAIMNTLLEMDKTISSRYTNSVTAKQLKYWQPSDIYYMYNNCYDTLCKIRLTSVNQYDLLIKLITTLNFERIPLLKNL